LRNEYPEPSAWERFLIKRRNFNKWLWNHSALYQFMRTRYNDLEFRAKSYFRSKYIEAAAPSRTHKKSTGDENPARARKDDPDFILDDKYFFDSEGWGLTRTLLLRLRDEVEKIGSRFIVIHFVGHDNFRLDMPFPRDEFNAFLEREQIKYVDLFPKLGDMDDDSNENLIPNDFHFSETGHRNFAKFTLDQLAEILADQQ
ncbi:MAG: SGNH/GDSL hydrolase family protein, partial [Nitrospinales bacterium]